MTYRDIDVDNVWEFETTRALTPISVEEARMACSDHLWTYHINYAIRNGLPILGYYLNQSSSYRQVVYGNQESMNLLL